MDRNSYIHYAWGGYRDYGVQFTVKGHEPGSAAAETANEKIFKVVKQQILGYASRLKQNNIATMEKKYNDDAKQQVKSIKDLLASAKPIDRYNFFKALAESAGFKGGVMDSIAQHTNFTKFKDGSVKSILHYKPTQKIDNLAKGEGYFSLPNASYFQSTSEDAAKWHEIKTLIKAIKGLEDKLKQASDVIKELDEYKDFCNRRLPNIKKYLEDITNSQARQYNIQQTINNSLAVKQQFKNGGVISHALASKIVDKIQTALLPLNAIAKIDNDLNNKWAEIEGTILAYQAMGYAINTIEDLFKVLSKSKSSGSKSDSLVNIKDTFIFAPSALSQELETTLKTLISKDTKEKIDNNATLSMFRNHKVMNKADIEYVFEMNGQKQYGNNISMKYTDLYSGEFGFPSIGLQESSLLLYLAGLKTPQGAQLHFLNVLAEHPDRDTSFDKIRESANEALAVLLLYQSLTGSLQNRSGGVGANIFAVKNPKTGYVNFFDMNEIILKVLDQNDIYNAVVFSPTLDSINLKNDWYGESKNWEDARRRMQKVFYEARLQPIKVSLSKQFLVDQFNLTK